ncbi:hypothetical protein OSB04_001819 [Centaurea solstitialis]|uniref:C3H1-type domain-containing protein n=1 Tax=Centaurea solstitialis TaxID=347529 RepID=A0AA38UAH0_9ASTR|nr:hypothetical protein OSB04_001819 [Centaurea solstitialis]
MLWTLADDDDAKDPKSDGGMMSAPFNESSKEVTGGGDSAAILNESNKIPHHEEEKETTQMSAKDVSDAQKESRLDGSLIRPRSSSPAVEINEGNKKPALICNFFVKGWCIKGNSCRFRHIREPTNASDEQKDQNSEPKDDEGLGDGIERSGLPTTEVNNPNEPQKEDPKTISSFDDVGPGGAQDNQHLLDKENPSNRVSSYATSIEELGGRGYQFGFRNHKTPVANYSLNYGSSSFQSATRTSPLNHGSVWPSSSWNSDSFGTVKHLGGDRELHPTSRPNVSPFSGSEAENLHRDNDHVPPHLTTKFSMYDWEPSKPFRSSFLISQGISISTPATQYDPIRDSIEQPKIGEKLSKFSSSSRTPSISSVHSLMDVNTPLKETFGTDYGSDRLSHVNGHDNATDVNSNACELLTSTEKTKTEAKGKNPHVGDVIQAREAQVNPDFVQQIDRPQKEIKTGDDSSHYRSQDFDIEGEGSRESKALKHFRAALIEFVKELVKPTWRDGKLSKDAHKVIVKKAVDKVINTLPPENIPNAAFFTEVARFLRASTEQDSFELSDGLSCVF